LVQSKQYLFLLNRSAFYDMWGAGAIFWQERGAQVQQSGKPLHFCFMFAIRSSDILFRAASRWALPRAQIFSPATVKCA
jgi:hypothetical protein